tara:strand:+ start:114 stop:797 length:684 start_codon:yes stop_codon:yes gene_type:complete
MIKKNDKGFALVLSLVLLLAMSLMGGALVITASSDHSSNNSSDEYQQTFYVAETALLEAQKSLMDQMIGPINRDSGFRDYTARSVPINQVDAVEGTRLDNNLTPCVRSFKNIDSSSGSDFRVVEYVRDQSFWNIIGPIIENDQVGGILGSDEEILRERTKLQTFRFEYLSTLVGTETYSGSGTSLKKSATNAQRRGAAYRLYGCGIMGSVDRPQILVPLETIVILAY